MKDPSENSAKAPLTELVLNVASLNSLTTVNDSAQDIQKSSRLMVNELLFFMNGTYSHHTEAVIKSTLTEFYREDEILSAKQLLVQSIDEFDGLHQFCKKRTGDNKVRATIDDIINSFKAVDEGNQRDSFLCS